MLALIDGRSICRLTRCIAREAEIGQPIGGTSYQRRMSYMGNVDVDRPTFLYPNSSQGYRLSAIPIAVVDMMRISV